MKKLILTVCNGNIHRSVIAAACISDMINNRGLQARYEVMSRGLLGTQGTNPPTYTNLREYPMEWRLTSSALKESNVKIPTEKQATPITRELAERAALILAMDNAVLRQNENSLIRQFPDLASKMVLFSALAGKSHSIPDLFRNPDEALYFQVIRELQSIINKHLDELLRLVNSAT